MFQWDYFNRRKVRAHGIEPEEAEQVVLNDAILVYIQDADGEERCLWYGESDGRRMLAVVTTERGIDLRVVTAYPLDAGQKEFYLTRRLGGE